MTYFQMTNSGLFAFSLKWRGMLATWNPRFVAEPVQQLDEQLPASKWLHINFILKRMWMKNKDNIYSEWQMVRFKTELLTIMHCFHSTGWIIADLCYLRHFPQPNSAWWILALPIASGLACHLNKHKARTPSYFISFRLRGLMLGSAARGITSRTQELGFVAEGVPCCLPREFRGWFSQRV